MGSQQVKVCDICGVEGFSNALLNCFKCPHTAVHLYCLGIPPGSLADDFAWVCEYCCIPTAVNHGDASTNRSKETSIKHAEDISEVKLKMTDISSLYPKSFTPKGKRKRQKRKQNSFFPNIDIVFALGSCKRNKVERTEDKSLSANKVDMGRETSLNDNLQLVLVEKQPEPLCTLLPIEYKRSSEQAKTSCRFIRTECASISPVFDSCGELHDPVSSFMERPEEIMGEVVLLVSPSGEIHIELTTSDDGCSRMFISSDPHIEPVGSPYISEPYSNPNLSEIVDEYGQAVQSCSIEEIVVLDEPSIETVEEIQAGHPVEVASVARREKFTEFRSGKVTLKVNRYNISYDLDPFLSTVLDKYGDIFHDCEMEPQHVIVNFCKIIVNLQSGPLSCPRHLQVDSLRNGIELAEGLGVDVKWLSNHFECLKEIAHKISQYPCLKKELAQGDESNKSLEEILLMKREKLTQLQEEIAELEEELESSKERTKSLECDIENIQSLCKRFHGRSLADKLL